jgi:hypothetical protein
MTLKLGFFGGENSRWQQTNEGIEWMKAQKPREVESRCDGQNRGSPVLTLARIPTGAFCGVAPTHTPTNRGPTFPLSPRSPTRVLGRLFSWQLLCLERGGWLLWCWSQCLLWSVMRSAFFISWPFVCLLEMGLFKSFEYFSIKLSFFAFELQRFRVYFGY